MGFHTMLTLGYLIPGLYLLIRIRQLFVPREYRYIYIIIYAILFLIYPVSNLIDEESDRIILKIPGIIANYLLPYLLYLFLFVILTDLLLLVNIVLNIVSRETIKNRSLRNKAFILINTMSLLVVIYGIINFNTIRTSEYDVNVHKKLSDPDNLRIAFISDFHLQEDTPVRFVNRAVQKINELNPDLVLFGGDIVEGDREDESMEAFEYLLRGIKSKYGVYGVLGNHEHYAGLERGSFFDRAGIKIISDSAVIIDRSLILAGRNDRHVRTRKSIDELMRSIPDSLPVILMDHRPDEIRQIAGTKADILLSGHTHHGQLFPINFITNKVYDLSWGYKKFGTTQVLVSSGIRLWGPPVRTTGKSEIVAINVHFTK